MTCCSLAWETWLSTWLAGSAAALQLAAEATGSATCQSFQVDVGSTSSVEQLADTIASSYDQQVRFCSTYVCAAAAYKTPTGRALQILGLINNAGAPLSALSTERRLTGLVKATQFWAGTWRNTRPAAGELRWARSSSHSGLCPTRCQAPPSCKSHPAKRASSA